jgi:hypothetical protein
VDACGFEDEEFTFPADDDTAGTGGPISLGFTLDGIRGLGRDEIRGGYDPDLEIPGDTYEPDPDDPDARLGGYTFTTCGNQIVTITIKIESHNQKIPAWEYALRLKSKLNFPSARARLQALELARNTVGGPHNVSYVSEEGNPVSAYAVELICNAATNYTDDPVTTIEQVDVRRGVIGGS